MALIVSGGLAPTISGKIGNSVWARNRGGAYIRNFAKPTNPSSSLQAAIRSTFSALVATWKNLDDATKTAFSDLASQVNNPNRVGLTSNPPPLALFQQINVGRVAAGLPIIEVAPAAPLTVDWGVDAFNIVGSTVDPAKIILTFTDSFSWTSETNGGLLLYLSAPLSPSINFFKGPYRFQAIVPGDPGSPAASPITLTLTGGQTIPPGTKVFWRAYVTTHDGHQGAVSVGSFLAGTT